MVEKKKTTKPAAKAAKKPAAKPAPKAPAKAAAKAAPAAPAPKPAKAPRPAKKAAAAPARPAATGVHDLAPASGATHYKKRLGRGPGSGHGKTAGRGHKGQRSRSGYRHQRGFEGGQMPLHRRVPKRGFTNIFRVEYDIVNLGDLADRFEAGASVTPETLATARLSRKSRPVKILGDGELKKALNVSAHKFSASAKARIEAAGGRCEVLSR
jgi:large subunit ribosomal protein L15